MRMLLRLILPIAVAILMVDQSIKWYVIYQLDLPSYGRIEVIPPFLNLVMAWNTGINFGIPLGGPWFLIGLAVVISGALAFWAIRRGTPAMAIGAGLVAGGALGNAVDRIVYGAVADFINNSCCGFVNPFSYNVADVAIFAGALWIAVKA